MSPPDPNQGTLGMTLLIIFGHKQPGYLALDTTDYSVCRYFGINAGTFSPKTFHGIFH